MNKKTWLLYEGYKIPLNIFDETSHTKSFIGKKCCSLDLLHVECFQLFIFSNTQYSISQLDLDRERRRIVTK